MRVLLVTSNWTETLGHAVRAIAVAQRLIEEGHEVGFLGFPSYEELLPQGVQFFPCESLPPGYDRDIFFGNHTYEDVVYVAGHTKDSHIISTVEREREVIRSFQPDMIFNDEQFTIGISARLEHIPVTALVTWPLHPEFNRDMEQRLPERRAILMRSRNCWNRILRKYGLAPIAHLSELLYASDCLITPTIPMLEPELKGLSSQVHYVGPLEPAGLFDSEPEWLADDKDDRPLIFIYLSSLQLPDGVNTEESFAKLYEAFDGQGYRVVMALGKFNTIGSNLPTRSADGSIRVETFVPGPALMKRAALAIYPATHSMMLSAARHRVPSLLLPDMFERQYNARCMERAGLGSSLPLMNMTPASILTACEATRRLGNLPAAKALQEELARMDGPGQIVRLMEAQLQASEEMSC